MNMKTVEKRIVVDMHELQGAEPLKASGDPFGYTGPAPHHVVYGSNGAIVELFANTAAGKWFHNLISLAAGAPSGSLPHAYITPGNVHHAVYRSAAGSQIVELFVNSSGQWVYNLLTEAAGAPPAASGPFGYQGPAPQHVIYRSKSDDIVELFVDGTGNWVHNVVSAAAGAPKAEVGSPHAYITPDNGHHIVYRSTNNHIVELFIDGGGKWVHNLLTAAAGAPEAGSQPFGYPGPAPQHVIYRSTSDDIVELFIDSTGNWVHNIVSAAAGAPKVYSSGPFTNAPATGAAPRAYITPGNHHIVYRSKDNEVVELFIHNGQWVHNVLTAAAGAPAAAGDPFGYVGPGPQHVVYRSAEGEVVELYINNTGDWAHKLITAIL